MKKITGLCSLALLLTLSACDDGKVCGTINISDEMTPQELEKYASCEIVEGDFIIHGSSASLYWDDTFPAFAVQEITGDLAIEGDFYFDFGFLAALESVGNLDFYASRKLFCPYDTTGCKYLTTEFPGYFYSEF
jgi:hypothetical protein